MLTAPSIRTSCMVAGGIHTPRCGGVTHAPAEVATTITPDAQEISWPRRCWWGATIWPSG